MDLAFAKDKKLQLALGGGAVLGLVVIVRKKGGGGGQGQTSSTTGTAGTLGTYNDQGMDAYQNLNDELQAGLTGFGSQITQVQDQLAKLTPPAGATTSGSAAPTPATPAGPAATKPKPKPKPPANPKARPGLDAHQLHEQHVKNKGAAPKPKPRR